MGEASRETSDTDRSIDAGNSEPGSYHNRRRPARPLSPLERLGAAVAALSGSGRLVTLVVLVFLMLACCVICGGFLLDGWLAIVRPETCVPDVPRIPPVLPGR